MTELERFKIMDENYADLVIENAEWEQYQAIQDISYLPLNNEYSILYIPVENMTYNAVYEFGYTAIPKCYGLMYSESDKIDESYYVHSNTEIDLRGNGVLIGFVDGGIDYRNPVFQNLDKTTRIVSIWDQSIENFGGYPEGFYYGTEFTKEQINQALMSENPLEVVPSIELSGQGSAMAGIAAGYAMETFRYSGIAPESELVIVKLKAAKSYLKTYFGIPEDTLTYQENDVMLGIKYLIETADRLQRPIVICIGLGSWQGSHKGEDIISKYISQLSTRQGVAVSVGSGEEGNRGNHFYDEILKEEDYRLVELNVSPNESFTMELWGFSPNILTVDIIAPNGSLVYQMKEVIIQENTIPVVYNNTSIFIDNRLQEPFAGDQLIMMRFFNMEEGVWRFRVKGHYKLEERFHIWLPIHQYISNGTFFLLPNMYTTISIPGNTTNLITVTAYNPIDQELYYYASRGYTKSFEVKPDITAPGVNMVAPIRRAEFESFTGTSMAAAYVAGISALLLEWGVVRRNLPSMNCTFIRYLLTRYAQRNDRIDWPNPNWGFGIVEDDIKQYLNRE
ncbi:hypothetical protein acsn021_32420 [Anaerocolumna cellulosilytica]|uniref:Uncharacterized protein n=1 Tax=Anaerocolumna cellulosilytica TaxID=433286 RepID=A0A6S6QWT1_9FIRM|nr:S8 family peptidase [Anaerocolumna cellulosilytica]MBB5196572.1 subtilisin family serine protease [Anaerocolumna cellulosilytica]BCJ95673.1 hypothetical protein acsn021_32420 [Anaerocolumna cellulosilytica]